MANKQTTGRFCTFKSSRRLHLTCMRDSSHHRKRYIVTSHDYNRCRFRVAIGHKLAWNLSQEQLKDHVLRHVQLWGDGVMNRAEWSDCGALSSWGGRVGNVQGGDCWATTTWDFESSCVDELLRGRILSHLRSVQYIRWGIIGHCQLWACGLARVAKDWCWKGNWVFEMPCLLVRHVSIQLSLDKILLLKLDTIAATVIRNTMYYFVLLKE